MGDEVWEKCEHRLIPVRIRGVQGHIVKEDSGARHSAGCHCESFPKPLEQTWSFAVHHRLNLDFSAGDGWVRSLRSIPLWVRQVQQSRTLNQEEIKVLSGTTV